MIGPSSAAWRQMLPDIIRTIFQSLPAYEYFRIAHGLCKRLRQYTFDDIAVFRAIAVQKCRMVVQAFTFVFKKDRMVVQINFQPKYCSDVFQFRKKSSIAVSIANTIIGKETNECSFVCIKKFQRIATFRTNQTCESVCWRLNAHSQKHYLSHVIIEKDIRWITERNNSFIHTYCMFLRGDLLIC